MANRNKNRGYILEKEIEDLGKDFGLDSQRAWGSDGRALGEQSDVDLRVEDWTIQSKRKKRLAKYMKPDNYSADIVVTREDYGQPIAIMMLEDFFTLLREIKELKDG